MRIVVMKKGGCKELAEKFDCTPQTISYALNFRKQGMLYRKIRHYAMNMMESVLL